MWLLRNAGFKDLFCKIERIFVQSLPNAELNDRIFDCLLASMAAVHLVTMAAAHFERGINDCLFPVSD